MREPFLSKSSGAALGAGLIGAEESLGLESHMPDDGLIFSDGVEADALEFRSGAVATIGRARRKTLLVAATAGARGDRASPRASGTART